MKVLVQYLQIQLELETELTLETQEAVLYFKSLAWLFKMF